MRLKKILSLCLAALLCITLSGCNFFDSNMDELLSPPKPEGDMYYVQQALEDSAGEGITLKYPVMGDYRSALTLKDINGDGISEAIALYSTTSDNTVTVHINLIAREDDSWTSKGDLSLVGNGVESISFSDLDGDSVVEIIVGWMVYSTVEKQVGIYTYNGVTLVQRALEPYTNFLCADLTGDGVKDMAVVYLNTTEKTASAGVFSLTTDGISKVGSTPLDGGVSSYSAPVLSVLGDGTPAVYIDAVKGSGMLTEIIWFKDGKLQGVYNPDAPEASHTYRNGSVPSRDYNKNGIIDIPVSQILISTANMADSDKVYYTNWSEFDGNKFNYSASMFMNYNDGYSITVPQSLKDKLLVIRKSEARLRFFYSYNPKTGTAGDELFKIVVIIPQDYNLDMYPQNDYILLERTDSLVYLAKISVGNSLGITQEDVRSMFGLIK